MKTKTPNWKVRREILYNVDTGVSMGIVKQGKELKAMNPKAVKKVVVKN